MLSLIERKEKAESINKLKDAYAKLLEREKSIDEKERNVMLEIRDALLYLNRSKIDIMNVDRKTKIKRINNFKMLAYLDIIEKEKKINCLKIENCKLNRKNKQLNDEINNKIVNGV